MAIDTLMSLPIAYGEPIIGWAVVAIVILLLIVPPMLYLLVLTFATDGRGFDRSVREIDQFVKARAQAWALGKDMHEALERR
jgi:chromate transport protein ChrA